MAWIVSPYPQLEGPHRSVDCGSLSTIEGARNKAWIVSF